MRTVGDWVALVCFVSLALLGWWVLLNGLSWPAVGVGAWWLILGLLAGMKPGEWQKATDAKGKRINGSER